MTLLRQSWGIKSIAGIFLSIELSCLPTLLVGGLIFSQLSGVSGAQLGWGMGFLVALLLFISVLMHEVGRAIAARAYGMSIESIVLSGLGSTATLQGKYHSPLQLLEVSLAGSVVNLSVFVLLSGLTSVRYSLGESLLTVVEAVKVLNVTLGLFYLIPGLPLDGAQMLRAVLWKKSSAQIKPWLARLGYAASAIAIATGLYYMSQHKIVGGVLFYLGFWTCVTHPETVLPQLKYFPRRPQDSQTQPQAQTLSKRQVLKSLPPLPKLTHFDAKFLPPAQPHERFAQGLHYVEHEKFQAAITIFSQVIQAKADCAEAYHNRGTAYLKVGDYPSALEDFKSSLRLNLHHAETYLGQGIAYANSGDSQGAIMAYSEALRLNPDSLSAYVNRANAYISMGQHQRAIADYKCAVQCSANPDEKAQLDPVREALSLLPSD